MQKLKNWLITRYLPAYASASAFEELSKLEKSITALKQENEEQQAVIAALKYALKCGRLLEIQLKGVDEYEHMVKRPENDK